MGKGANVLPLSDNLVRDVKPSLYLLMGAVLGVLVMACLNVANLFVARGTAWRKEFAVRAALGGSRWRIIREQLTESLLLTFLGETLGTLLAWSAIRWLVALRENLPRANSIHIDQVPWSSPLPSPPSAVSLPDCFPRWPRPAANSWDHSTKMRVPWREGTAARAFARFC
jgi:ABC-type lipoprotein release transport system permease subunit